MGTTTSHRRRSIDDLRAANEARCRRLVDRAEPLDVGDLDWDAVGAWELDADVLGVLVYMRDVEGFTDRDPVGLSAHPTTLADPLVRTFLEQWRVDEANHTRALERFLDAYERTGARFPDRQAPPPSVPSGLERILTRCRGTVGEVVATAHMTWGAANEHLTLTGYRLLADRCGHPVLAQLLRRIAVQEGEHFSFYRLQAEWRLAASRSARAILPRLLRRVWTPVGVGDGYKPAAEFERVLDYLCEDEAGQAALGRINARFADLPGMDGLRLFRTTGSSAAA